MKYLDVGICFTGMGMVESVQLNNIKGIRAAVVHSLYIAGMCRQHNNANVCVIGTDSIGTKLSSALIMKYLHS